MQHQTVHGDACICHSCAPTAGSVALTPPHSKVCAHPPVDGLHADVASRGDYLAQIFIGGRPPSAPVTAREARIR
jgi:hypothetical protein